MPTTNHEEMFPAPTPAEIEISLKQFAKIQAECEERYRDMTEPNPLRTTTSENGVSLVPLAESLPMCKLAGTVEPLRISLMEGEQFSQSAEILVNSTEWVDVEFEVALDSGCTDNVCHEGDVPGYVLEPSAGSKAGQHFIVGNGQKVPNNGQVNLSLQTDGAEDKRNNISTVFQVAKVSRPLMSVGRLCDAGMDVIFRRSRADVVAPGGSRVMSFERQGAGLDIAKLRLKRPPEAGFTWQER